ncbi:MAG: hypothetical protein MUO54_07020 [Anaerolineales bacterium]|nr:hypothetical protein [Anaerolineales bacterium]
MKKFWTIFPSIVLSACISLTTPESVETATPTAAPSPTPAVEWFPPTPTPEQLPTIVVTPTQELMSEIGEIIFQDALTSSEEWTFPQTDRGQININKGEINIIINEPKTLLVGTLEKPDLQDFYAEITANPVLCTGKDEYGFLFRVIGRDQYFRFALSCEGEVRIDKIIEGGVSVLYPWTRSASVPVGAPSISKLEVFALRGEIRIFINGDSQVVIPDQEIQAGSFGVFARSAGETAVTVSFSDLIIREVIPK